MLNFVWLLIVGDKCRAPAACTTILLWHSYRAVLGESLSGEYLSPAVLR